MLLYLILVVAAGVLVGLLCAESARSNWLALGLILGLVGDVCLALPGQAAFRFGAT